MTTQNSINAPIPFSLANGGTGADLTASNGGIFYSTASAGAILAGTSTAHQILLSGASTTPLWSTATFPTTTTINQILYSSAANTVAGLATANNGVLLTSGTGVPSIGNATVAVGGTGNTTFTAYSVICAGTTATGSFQNVSGVGSSGQVLTSNGASALPTWQAAGGGSGNYTYITSATASSQAYVTFTSLFSSTYTQYYFLFDQVLPATNAVDLYVQLGTGSSPTWTTSGYNYTTLDAATAYINQSNQAQMDITGDNNTQQISNAGSGCCGSVLVTGPNGSSNIATVTSLLSFSYSGSSLNFFSTGSGNVAAANWTSIRFYFSSGNVASGTIAVYGVST